MSFSAVLFVLAFQQPDPLAPARAGQILCYEPDVTRRTCYGTATYRWLSDRTIVSDIVVAASADPPVIMHSSAPVFIRDDQECTLLVPSAGQITAIHADGEWTTGSDFESFRRNLGSIIDQANGPGSELCFAHEASADGGLTMTARVDGVIRAELEGAARWVDPADGWRVAY